MNSFFQKSPLHQDKITYEYCHEAYLHYLKKRGMPPFFISGWNVGSGIQSPDRTLREVIPNIEDNINTYYLIEDDIGKSEVVEYLSKRGCSIKLKQVLVANSATSLLCYTIFSTASNDSGVLVLNPSYYSTYDSLSLIKCDYITMDVLVPSFSYDCNRIENILMCSNVHTIIITDPIFGSGIKTSEENLSDLIFLANKYHCTLVVDMARYGLSWTEQNEPLIGERLISIQKAHHHAVIYSPCKKIFANGIKTGVLICSEDIAETLACYSDSFLGAVSSAQVEFLKVLLLPVSENYLHRQMKQNIDEIKNRYDIVKTIASSSELDVFTPHMGHYALCALPLYQNSYKKTFHKLLDKAETYTLPMSLYGLSDDIHYFFRVNLLTDNNNLMQSLWRMISILEYN